MICDSGSTHPVRRKELHLAVEKERLIKGNLPKNALFQRRSRSIGEGRGPLADTSLGLTRQFRLDWLKVTFLGKVESGWCILVADVGPGRSDSVLALLYNFFFFLTTVIFFLTHGPRSTSDSRRQVKNAGSWAPCTSRTRNSVGGDESRILHS